MTRGRFFSYLLLVVLLTSWTQADPIIVSSPDTVSVYTGETAVLRCQVQDLGRNEVSWSSVSRDFTIYQGNRLLTNDVIKYSLINVPEGSVFDLQILTVEKSDQGFYKCAIDGTSQQLIVRLDVVDMPDFALAQGEPLNMTDCCIAEGVMDTCLPACYPDQIDLDTFDALTNCGTIESLKGLAKCFAAGSNHDNCCLNRGVDTLCVDFCHGYIPDVLTEEHLTKCYTSDMINGIFDCFEMGFEHLPSEPTQVGALATHDGTSGSILVKWSAPIKNPHTVTGYKIMYRPRTDETYKSILINNPNSNQYRLMGDKDKIVSNMDYKIYVSALADHGISFGSVEVDVFVPDPSLQGQMNQDIDSCCADRNVDEKCRNMLCRSKTWSHFSTEDVLSCFSYVNSIFTCLVGERNHTNCCAAYDVTADCQPLCSGHPPTFDSSLINCVSQMNIIEGCVQEGYESLPAPPSQLSLESVDATSAVLFFQPSQSPGLIHYVMELRVRNESAPFQNLTYIGLTSRVFSLSNLQPNTYYWVRLISETASAGSLPSETVSFLTYPEGYEQPTPPPVTNLPHNLTGCCIGTGMPEVCWKGCEYRPNITAYYATVLEDCYDHIGSVLACAADGRDHTECCKTRDVQTLCLDLCAHTKKGPLDPQYVACIADTPKAVMCYMEGILDLPRHPDVYVSAVSKTTISLQWEQPKTSGRIDMYIIEYGIKDMTKENVTTDKTSYILQNLQPGKAYEISVTSKNENGTSPPSPIIQQYTMSDMTVIIPSINQTEVTGRAMWENITHCCENNVSPACQAQCQNKQQTAGSQSQDCIMESHKMLACFADGQDHRLCCEEKNLPSTCLPLCGGHALEVDITMATCMSYSRRDIILSCFLENNGLIPGAPPSLLVKRTAEGDVQLQWGTSSYCGTDCSYIIHYWKEGQLSNVINIMNATSPYTVKDLETDYKYTFTVAARNRYGSSPPASWQTLFVSNYERVVKLYLRNENVWVEQGETVYLYCAMAGFDPSDSSYQIRWYFQKKRQLDNDGRDTLTIRSADLDRDQGDYTCTVTDSVLSSSDTLFLPVKSAPKFDQLRNEPGDGNSAKIACWFWGYPDSDEEQWYKDGVLIRRNLQKYSMNIDVRYHTGITSYRLKMANIEESDYGIYSINVSNKFGHDICHVKFAHPNDTGSVISPPKPADPIACCKDLGVSELCQELCGFHVNVSEIINDLKYITCLAHFEAYVKCGADGRDHSKCCKDQGVLPYCVPLCSGVVPGDVINNQEEMIQCVAEVSAIFKCAEKGHDLLPFAPENILLSLQDNGRTIRVRWSKPFYSQDKIEHFTLYYNFTGQPTPKTVNLNVLLTEHSITDVQPQATYYIWMTSGNKNGNSLASEIKKIDTELPRDIPTNLKATLIENSADVRLTWEMANDQMYEGFAVYYKKLNEARYQSIPVGRTKAYRLVKLEPQTTYSVYVVAMGGEETSNSPPSNEVQFTTGSLVDSGGTSEQQGDDNSKRVAIGVGVTVALLALIAIIFLVVFFVYRARVFKPRTNDSVAFENPGYGNQEHVKIQGVDGQFNYGRLQEDGASQNQHVYDNPSGGESSTDPHNENPMYFTLEPQETPTAPTLQINSSS